MLTRSFALGREGVRETGWQWSELVKRWDGGNQVQCGLNNNDWLASFPEHVPTVCSLLEHGTCSNLLPGRENRLAVDCDCLHTDSSDEPDVVFACGCGPLELWPKVTMQVGQNKNQKMENEDPESTTCCDFPTWDVQCPCNGRASWSSWYSRNVFPKNDIDGRGSYTCCHGGRRNLEKDNWPDCSQQFKWWISNFLSHRKASWYLQWKRHDVVSAVETPVHKQVMFCRRSLQWCPGPAGEERWCTVSVDLQRRQEIYVSEIPCNFNFIQRTLCTSCTSRNADKRWISIVVHSGPRDHAKVQDREPCCCTNLGVLSKFKQAPFSLGIDPELWAAGTWVWWSKWNHVS